jgi:heavy metal sensor kinase
VRWQPSIRLRLTAWYILLLALILIAFSLVLYAALSDQLHRSLDDRLRLQASSIAAQLGQTEIEPREDESRPVDPLSGDFPVRLLDPAGAEVYAFDTLRGAPVNHAALAEATEHGSAYHTLELPGAPARAYVIVLRQANEAIGFLEVAQPLSVVQTPLRDLALILLLAVPATLALASFSGLFIADRALRPIGDITREAQRISEHQLDRRLNLDLPNDEVGRLARTFDAMLARLDAAFQRQRRFTADASHELRTPLTVMKGTIDVTLNRPREADDYRATLSQVNAEVDRMTRLTEDLLLLARADAGRPLAQPRDMDLAACLRQVTDDLRSLAAAKALALEVAAPDALPTHADPDQVRRMLSNLIENAIKYTPRGRVKIHAERVEAATGAQSPAIRITIADTGPGIAPEHLPHVFERFYRADESRARRLGGSGLGLAIARSIATAHGGAIELRSEVGVGTTVVVTLPVESG